MIKTTIMKTLNHLLRISLIAVPLMLASSCERDNGNSSIRKEAISGYVQKGPFLIGTTLSLSELNSDLGQTGKVFHADISNNSGVFSLNNVELSSRFVEIKANGFYFNEVQGENSAAQLTLSALSDISDKSSLNVNVLSHLEKDRLLHLIGEGQSFSEAKKQAQEEILEVFSLEKGDMAESELLNIAEAGEDNAILLAVSVIMQGHLSVADMSELIGKLNADLKEDGILDDASIGTALMNNAVLADLDRIRSNLENRYAELGMEVTIPAFEEHVRHFIDSSGFEFNRFPVYPRTSPYGTNVLYLERDTFNKGQDLSLAADLPDGTSLMILLKGGLWFYRAAPAGPVNWNISEYDWFRKEQSFEASKAGELSDLSIDFDVAPGSSAKFQIEYYENGSDAPTRVREIVVLDPLSGGGFFSFPDEGDYGPNILALDGDTLYLGKEVKYSLTVRFPEWDEASIAYDFMFEGSGLILIDPSEIFLWETQLDTSYMLQISASGKNIRPDMSIVFPERGICNMTGSGIYRTLKIE
jgi:hypothetical protein